MLIVGTGAVATMLAERCFRNGRSFQMFGSPSERLRSLESRFPGCTVSEPSRVSRHRFWIVAVKTGQNAEKVRLLEVAPTPEAVLVLQNGFRPESDWFRLSPKVDRGLSTYGVKSRGPGFVVGGGKGSITVLQGSPFINVLTGLGFHVSEEVDMEPAIWRKLAVIASLNVVASVYGIHNGETLDIPEAARMMQLASDEVEQVARAVGVNFGPLSGWEITREVALGTAHNVCSTLADLRSGRVTEYQAINGEILNLASHLEVDVPTLRTLDQEFHSIGSAVEAA